ncbi:MAG: sigma-70 family RNA polymerase sigma factor [Magnetospiraceae bacterium]
MSDIRLEIVALIPHLRRFAAALTRDRGMVDDLVQDVLVRALSKLDKFQPGTNLRAWLFTIMRNVYLSQLRKYKSRPQLTVIDAEMAGQPASQDDTMQLRDLEQALNCLPDDQRITLLLVALEGMSYQEAAAVTDVAVGTVRSRVARAREALRQRLAVADPPGTDVSLPPDMKLGEGSAGNQ